MLNKLLNFSVAEDQELTVAIFLLKLGACGLVDRALDSRLKDLGFDSPLLIMCWADFSFHTASVCPAVMGTWWNYES